MDEFGPVVGYNVQLPVSAEDLRANVAHALSLGLPEMEQAPRRAARLSLAATGPTFAAMPRGQRPVLAVNGALGLMAARGEVPEFWAACDPQALIADFLAEAPWQTTYLVCSQCHPAVFKRLMDGGAKVLLWHLDDPAYADLLDTRLVVPCLGAITPTALFSLGPMLGFTGFDTWGWDGCFRDGRHHATDQAHDGEIVQMEIAGRRFFTMKTWLYEMECAVNGFRVVPLDTRIHGDGMYAAAFEALGFTRPEKEAA